MSRKEQGTNVGTKSSSWERDSLAESFLMILFLIHLRVETLAVNGHCNRKLREH